MLVLMTHRITYAIWLALITVSCRLGSAEGPLPSQVEQKGTLRPSSLRESSGIVPAQGHPGVFWTHNDGKNRNLFAVDIEGKLVGIAPIEASFTDWEDIASDRQGHLYLADTGNNEATRTEVRVYKIREPNPTALPRSLPVLRSWALRFPKEPFDCESLFVWDGYGYLISKVFNDAKASLYRFPLNDSEAPLTLERVTKLKIDSPVTGADISPDGTKVAFVCKSGAGVFTLPEPGQFKSLGDQKPFLTKFRHEHIEACCFIPEGLLATAESREIYLFTAPEFRTKP